MIDVMTWVLFFGVSLGLLALGYVAVLLHERSHPDRRPSPPPPAP
jgi:hypothetical protein